MEKDKALFVAFYFWGGYNKGSVWQEFDRVHELAEKFVQTYDPNETWEEESFEEFMEHFILSHEN